MATAEVTGRLTDCPPGPERAAERVAELARSLAEVTEERRALPDELVDALREAGLLRAAVPEALGGAELPPGVILRCAEEVARGDASAGWCVSINATSSLLSAYLPERGAAEVFGDPRSVAAGVWAPRGAARPVDGGVIVSGRWPFCSAISHSDWLFAGSVLQSGGDGGNGAPVLKVLAIPTQELNILDTWHTSGLCGTGSHDATASELFVPEHRMLSVLDGPPPGAPALYRFPVFGFFALSIAVATLGNARGAIDELVQLAAGKRSLGSTRALAERGQVQGAVAAAEASLRAARAFLFQAVDEAWAAASGPEPVPDSARVALRLAATHATRTSAEVVASMYDLAGGSAIYRGSPLQRRFRDAHTATAHFQVNPATYELLGRLLLGRPARTEQL
ncbi:MAG TPA: acyl-CoA dehydrogenase family protein [Pseudonocardia sp.]|uniref:acyl-CoA dehydrogenase family protein n=1 Tax=Pseudonocardia sp. TaxID=60912 RepID=UPI002EDBAD49